MATKTAKKSPSRVRPGRATTAEMFQKVMAKLDRMDAKLGRLTTVVKFNFEEDAKAMSSITDTLKKLRDQVKKVRDEVAAGNVSQEDKDLIAEISAATTEIDEMNPDPATPPADPVDPPPAEPQR